jgi:hypothetical protein
MWVVLLRTSPPVRAIIQPIIDRYPISVIDWVMLTPRVCLIDT